MLPKAPLKHDREAATASDEHRARLREFCLPSFDGPRPRVINIFGWIITGIGALCVATCLVFLIVSIAGLLRQRGLAGERLFASSVGLAYAVFFTRVWNCFRVLPDWRVALDVPLRLKVFGAAGAAVSAALSGGALALLVFAVCAKTTFLRLMDGLGMTDVSKVQVIFICIVTFSFFLLLWVLFQGVMELRAWARTALGMVFGCGAAVSGVVLFVGRHGLAVFSNGGLSAACWFVGTICVLGLVLMSVAAGAPDVARHFCADELR